MTGNLKTHIAILNFVLHLMNNQFRISKDPNLFYIPFNNTFKHRKKGTKFVDIIWVATQICCSYNEVIFWEVENETTPQRSTFSKLSLSKRPHDIPVNLDLTLFFCKLSRSFLFSIYMKKTSLVITNIRPQPAYRKPGLLVVWVHLTPSRTYNSWVYFELSLSNLYQCLNLLTFT